MAVRKNGEPAVSLGDCKCWICQENRRTAEMEKTAGFLAECWILLDAYARGGSLHPADARAILRKQQAPGWIAKVEDDARDVEEFGKDGES